MRDKDKHRSGYCIYIDTLIDGPVPVEQDEKGNPIIYDTEAEAQRVIAEDTVGRLQEYLAGQRGFEDAMTVEEYVVPVDVLPDGAIIEGSRGCRSSDSRKRRVGVTLIGY